MYELKDKLEESKWKTFLAEVLVSSNYATFSPKLTLAPFVVRF